MTMLSVALLISQTAGAGLLGFAPDCAEPTGHWGLGTPGAIVISEPYPDPPFPQWSVWSIQAWGTVLSASPVTTDSYWYSVAMPGVVHDLLLDGDLLFAALDWAGVEILRFDPFEAMDPIVRMRFAHQAQALAYRDGLLVVADGSFGFRLVDVTDPADPKQLSSVPAFDWVADAAFSGEELVVADGSGIRVFDISEPTRPRQVGSSGLSYEFSSVTKVAVYDGYAYAGYKRWSQFSGVGGGVRVYDLEAPGGPEYLGYVRGGGPPSGVVIVDDLVFVTYQTGLNVWEGGMQILDLSDPREPEIVYQEIMDEALFALASTGDLTLISRNGIQVLDTSNPSQPIVLKTIEHGQHYAARAILCNDHLVVTEMGRSLRILSHDNGRPLREVGRLTLNSYGGGLACGGDVVFCGAGGATAVDISNPARPRVLDELTSFDHTSRTLALRGDTLYISGGGVGGLEIVDVSDPSDLVTLSDLFGLAGSAMAVRDDHLYASAHGRFSIYDVTTPGHLALVAELAWPFDQTHPFTHVAINGGTAFVIGNPGLVTVDVSDPAAPVFLGAADIRGGRITIAGDRGYIPTGSGVDVVDLSVPEKPRFVGSFETPGGAWSTLWLGHELLVADGPMGVTSYDISGCRTCCPQPALSGPVAVD
jgi:hypothetical protein